MTEISKEIFEIVNKPGRVGVLGNRSPIALLAMQSVAGLISG